ncbi:MAG: MBL fold metallo-hydrolase [Thermaerobacter sp.]|nr:MBL fold metallo-hydrolase [Thermaerobacter sp.]
MVFHQILDPRLGCASYLVGCPESGELLVVDPLEAVGVNEYVLRAADLGLQVTQIVDTHLHADHVSVGRELATATGAIYMLHKDAAVTYPFVPVGDGDEISIGRNRVRVLHTPGHTDESISLLVFDGSRSLDLPWMILSGDSLFVGDVARPDLAVDELSDEDIQGRLGRLRQSVEKLAAYPEFVELYPGHYGVSACGGAGMSAKASSTIGFEQRFNAALQTQTGTGFAEFVRIGMKPLPDRYQEIKRHNMGLD